MKKIILILLASLFIATGMFGGDGISFINQNLKKALKKAKKENKIVFVDAYTTWCGPCKWMASSVFTEEAAADFYNDNFINLKLDMEEGAGIEFAEKYAVNAFPTLLFLNASGQVVHKALGARDVADFIALGKTALDPEERLSYFIDNYETMQGDPDFLKKYAYAARNANMSNYKSIGQEYLKHVDDWLQDTSTAHFAFNVMEADITSKSFQYVHENRQGFYNFIKEDRVDDVLTMVIANSFEEEVSEEEVGAKILEYFPVKGEKMIANQRMDNLMYSNHPADIREFANYAILYVEKYDINDESRLNQIAWHYYEVISDVEYLKKAAQMAEKSISISSNYYNSDTAAALYFKIGNKEKAMSYANKAIELAKESDMDYASTTELIEKIKDLK